MLTSYIHTQTYTYTPTTLGTAGVVAATKTLMLSVGVGDGDIKLLLVGRTKQEANFLTKAPSDVSKAYIDIKHVKCISFIENINMLKSLLNC